MRGVNKELTVSEFKFLWESLLFLFCSESSQGAKIISHGKVVWTVAPRCMPVRQPKPRVRTTWPMLRFHTIVRPLTQR